MKQRFWQVVTVLFFCGFKDQMADHLIGTTKIRKNENNY
jgi:hypothetical protein